MVVDNHDIFRFNVSMDDANNFKKVKHSHQLTGDAYGVNLICVRPQIHMQELEDQTDVPNEKKGVESYDVRIQALETLQTGTFFMC